MNHQHGNGRINKHALHTCPIRDRKEELITKNHKFLKKNSVSIIGAGLNEGQGIPGCESTPNAYRKNVHHKSSSGGYFKELEEVGWKVKDTGDMDFAKIWANVKDKKPDKKHKHFKAHKSHHVGVCSEALAEKVYQEAKNGENFVLTIGGDHSVAFGSLAGIFRARPDTKLIWVDAHADCNTPSISPSGNMHGMPVGAHLGAKDFKGLPGWDWFEPVLHADNTVFIGLRHLDKVEKQILRGIGAHVYTMHEVDKLGIGEVMRQAMQILNPHENHPMHLSFDIDGVDPQWAPSTGTICEGGISYREARFICEYLAKTNCLCSMDLAEINTEILQGALAGQAGKILTTTCETVKNMKEDLLDQLKRNPAKTMRTGWNMVKCALGDSLI
eukprot:UN31313